MVVVVQEYGASIRKEGKRLILEKGDCVQEICIDKVDELCLHPSCSITTDAVLLCLKQDIPIHLFDRMGNPQGEVSSFSGGCAPIYKRKQLLITYTPEGVELVKGFLVEKIQNRIRHLKEILRNKRKEETRTILQNSIRTMEEEVRKMECITGENVNEVRLVLQGLEGTAGKSYFHCISKLLPQEYDFQGRGQNAKDMYNCMLNYLYGILYSVMKQSCYAARLDPYIGIMHVDQYNKPTFTYDLIEKYRILCERLVYDICCHREIQKDSFVETDFRLEMSDDAKKQLIRRFYQMLSEPCYYHHKRMTRKQAISRELLQIAEVIGGLDKDVLAVV